MSTSIFIALMRNHREVPKQDPDPRPPFTDVELYAVTAAFIAMEAPATVK